MASQLVLQQHLPKARSASASNPPAFGAFSGFCRSVGARPEFIGTILVSAAVVLLDLIVGYGYRVGRALMVYICTILAFAGVYFAIGQTLYSRGPISPLEALIVSIIAFHGRGFFPSTFFVGDPQAEVGAFEAVIGLVVEITLVAAFTRRAFGRQG
jgi:hypothetical protein